MITTENPVERVEEVQGLYGPFSFPEKLLQKIWLRREFQHAHAHMQDGRAVEILHPGRWNLLGGPDFKSARLRFEGGPEIIGDVEIHLHESEWSAHGHASDPAYRDVKLHVVLFQPEMSHTRGNSEVKIPILVLLPLLDQDLEAYAADAMIETAANRPVSRLQEELLTMAPSALREWLATRSHARWAQKVRFAHARIERLGWEAACHHAALEILGYRFNRSALLHIATAFPLAEWESGRAIPEIIYAENAGRWAVQGVRPANQPLTRLRQYAEWTRRVPRWPEVLRAESETWPAVVREERTSSVRRLHQFPEWTERLRAKVCGQAVGGCRWDNLVCDGLLPLLAAEGADVEGMWHHWIPGDLPPVVQTLLRLLSSFGAEFKPASQGVSQAIFDGLIELEQRNTGVVGRET